MTTERGLQRLPAWQGDPPCSPAPGGDFLLAANGAHPDTAAAGRIAMSPPSFSTPGGTCSRCGTAEDVDPTSGMCAVCLASGEGEPATLTEGVMPAEPETRPSARSSTCKKCGALLAVDVIGEFCPQCVLNACMPGAPSDSEIPPAEVPGYRCLRRLGRGAMGVVWLAEQVATRRNVAIKFCKIDHSFIRDTTAVFEQFQREIAMAARLEHPNLARIHAGGEAAGIPYYVMEYVEGTNLTQYVRTRSLGKEAIVVLMEKVCAAVDHAHSHETNIIHRDLKPSNIMVTHGGEPKVLDFGLAKALAEDDEAAVLSDTGDIKGTPLYMSPEQATGGTVGPASDVYSLAVILFELLTGQHPHGSGVDGRIPSTLARDTKALLVRIATHDVRRPRSASAGIDRILELVLLRALQRKPEDRYAVAGEFGDDLRRWRTSERTRAGGVWSWARFLSRRWVRQHPAVASAVVVALFLAGVGALAYREAGHRSSRASVAAAQSERERRPRVALAHLAQALAAQPANEIAYREVVSILTRTAGAIAPWSHGDAIRHGGRMYQAAFSLDSRWIATAGEDGAAKLWEVESGRAIGAPLPHRAPVRCLAFSPDGQWLAAGGEDHSVTLWNVESRTLQDTIRGHAGAILSIAFSPDSHRLATASDDATAGIWECATGRRAGEFLPHKGPVTSVSYSPDGSRLLTASTDGRLRIWRLAESAASAVELPQPGGARIARFSPDGTRVATSGNGTEALLWKIDVPQTGGEPPQIPLSHGAAVSDLNFSADGSFLVTASRDGTAQVWDVETGDPMGPPLRHGASLQTASFSADGTRILTSDDSIARVWDWPGAEPVQQTLHHRGVVTRATFTGDGRQLLTACWGGEFTLWHLPAGRVVMTHPGTTDVIWAASSHDGTRIASIVRGEDATVWDVKSSQALPHRFGHKDLIWSADFSPDGRHLVTASEDSTAQVWEVESGKRVGEPLVHEAGVKRAAFSPDGRWIATASDDGSARIWDALSHKATPALLRHAAPTGENLGVRSVAFSPDSRSLVTGGSDERARVWDVATGRERIPPLHHAETVWNAEFSRDGRWIVTASYDHIVRVWDARTGALWDSFAGHRDGVLDASFSPDGRWIASASADRTARLWEVPVVSERAPAWVPQFLTTLAGVKITGEGKARRLSEEERNASREALRALPEGGGEWHRIMRWALSDPHARALSPHSGISLREDLDRTIRWVIEQHAKGSTPPAAIREDIHASARAIQRLAPAHPLVHFALAAGEETPARAEFLYRYGIQHLPAEDEVVRQAVDFLERLNQPERAAAVRATPARPSTPPLKPTQ